MNMFALSDADPGGGPPLKKLISILIQKELDVLGQTFNLSTKYKIG